MRLAHTLKGVSGSIGADELQGLAAQLEAALKTEASALPAGLAETASELDRVLGLIRAPRAAGGESAALASALASALPQDLVPRLQELMEKLEEYDSQAEDILFAILDDVKGTEVHAMLQAVKKQIGQYDMEAAAEELSPLIGEIETLAGNSDG